MLRKRVTVEPPNGKDAIIQCIVDSKIPEFLIGNSDIIKEIEND